MADEVELLDFETFFEADAERISAEGWICGCEFSYRRGEDQVAAAVGAVDGELSLKWWQGEMLRADIRLTGIVDWIFESESGREQLRLKFEEPKFSYFIIQLRPHVSLGWATQWA